MSLSRPEGTGMSCLCPVLKTCVLGSEYVQAAVSSVSVQDIVPSLIVRWRAVSIC